MRVHVSRYNPTSSSALFHPVLAVIRCALTSAILFLLLMQEQYPLCSQERANSSGVSSGIDGTSEMNSLLPAAFGIWTDRSGSSWSVEADGNIGRIGSTMVNSGLALLVNDEKFSSYQPMMTRDGKEFYLQGQPMDSLPGLRVHRRIRLLEQRGGLRYAELFHNGSANPMRLTVALNTNFSGNFKTFLSDRGQSEPVLLSPYESGVVVLPGSSQSSRAFLFTLSDVSGGEKPTISSQNRYGLSFRYRLDLAPGETGVIVHHVAQVVIPQSFDRRTLLELSRPFSLESIQDTFESDWRPFLVNALLAPKDQHRRFLESGGLASLGVRSSDKDVLVIGKTTRLSGKVDGESVKLVSNYGEVEVGLDQVAAIAGQGYHDQGVDRLFLHDGQILSGTLAEGVFGFQPVEGARMDLEFDKLDRLVFAEGKKTDLWPEKALAVIETHDGDRFTVSDNEVFILNLVTSWGARAISLDELLWLSPADGGDGSYLVELKDGTRFRGFLGEGDISLFSGSLGEISLPISRLRYLITENGWKRRAEDPIAIVGPSLHLLDGQVIAGSLSETGADLLSGGNKLQVTFAEIRRIERVEDAIQGSELFAEGISQFRLERWDAGVMSGVLPLQSVEVKTTDYTWRVPMREIARIDLAAPGLDQNTQKKIQSLVRDLGSPEWATRESATRELSAFGYLAQPLLQRELTKTSDPEVGRRLEQVLAELN